MTARDFRRLLLAELAKLGYHETFYDDDGRSSQMIGHHYPEGGGCPTPGTCWSLVATTTKSGKVVVTVPMPTHDTVFSQQYRFCTDLTDANAVGVAHAIIRWLPKTSKEFRCLPDLPVWPH